ncbi:hypothetical protein [Mesorhizobium sp. SP-1A]|uniref:hypothetical protein n=1 Tax=Mesorhizobium sp. SP-1A TaxID=3077840 RepID=UPI0028F71F7C|nr:hypothetical protein [Mesorhizobium sp. SP-1A]
MRYLVGLAKQGLPKMHRDGVFAHTARGVQTPSGRVIRLEGENLRYATNVALGLAFLPLAEQRQILDGSTAADLAISTIVRAETVHDDPGAVALAAWAGAEAAGVHASSLFVRLEETFDAGVPLATVACAWTLIACMAARHLADTRRLSLMARDRLLQGQGPGGLFPHMLPGGANGRLRAHVGSFADQVYSIQALSRLAVAEGDEEALTAADACGGRICALQGPAGQWWWHYDMRNGSVVEGYPVYSVHQHAMAPMALLDLREAGGTDHMDSVLRGVSWLDKHPETSDPLVSEKEHVIWRKAGRREPRKMVRSLAALTTATRPGLLMPGVDVLFPPCKVDYECRPYEFGWLLYAWLAGGVVQRLRSNATTSPDHG